MLNEFFDFEELRQLARKPGAPLLQIGAVEVLSGHFELFTGEELCAECLLASAAIPEMFRAVTVPGRGVYWDGLFSQNPPIHDLIDLRIDELWLIQINPSTCARVPTETHEILDRRNALSGNLSMEQELAFIDTLNRAIASGGLKDHELSPDPGVAHLAGSRARLALEDGSAARVHRRAARVRTGRSAAGSSRSAGRSPPSSRSHNSSQQPPYESGGVTVMGIRISGIGAYVPSKTRHQPRVIPAGRHLRLLDHQQDRHPRAADLGARRGAQRHGLLRRRALPGAGGRRQIRGRPDRRRVRDAGSIAARRRLHHPGEAGRRAASSARPST